MEENQKKAFDFSADLTKQLITLSTGIFTLTVTFSKDIIGSADNASKYLLLTSWIIFIISILFGLLTLSALTGNLDPAPEFVTKPDGSVEEKPAKPLLTIRSSNVTSTAKWQMYTFAIALILTCWYGYLAISMEKTSIKTIEAPIPAWNKCDHKPQIIIENNPVFNNNNLFDEKAHEPIPPAKPKKRWCKCPSSDSTIISK